MRKQDAHAAWSEWASKNGVPAAAWGKEKHSILAVCPNCKRWDGWQAIDRDAYGAPRFQCKCGASLGPEHCQWYFRG